MKNSVLLQTSQTLRLPSNDIVNLRFTKMHKFMAGGGASTKLTVEDYISIQKIPEDATRTKVYVEKIGKQAEKLAKPVSPLLGKAVKFGTKLGAEGLGLISEAGGTVSDLVFFKETVPLLQHGYDHKGTRISENPASDNIKLYDYALSRIESKISEVDETIKRKQSSLSSQEETSRSYREEISALTIEIEKADTEEKKTS